MTRDSAQAYLIDLVDLVESPFIDRYGDEFVLEAEMTGIVATAVAMGLSRAEILARLGSEFDTLIAEVGPAVVNEGLALRHRRHGGTPA